MRNLAFLNHIGSIKPEAEATAPSALRENVFLSFSGNTLASHVMLLLTSLWDNNLQQCTRRHAVRQSEPSPKSPISGSFRVCLQTAWPEHRSVLPCAS